MRTLVDIGEQQVKALDALARTAKRARAAIIREAIDDYLAKQSETELEDAFGLWGQGPDGLACQQTLRNEW